MSEQTELSDRLKLALRALVKERVVYAEDVEVIIQASDFMRNMRVNDFAPICRVFCKTCESVIVFKNTSDLTMFFDQQSQSYQIQCPVCKSGIRLGGLEGMWGNDDHA